MPLIDEGTGCETWCVAGKWYGAVSIRTSIVKGADSEKDVLMRLAEKIRQAEFAVDARFERGDGFKPIITRPEYSDHARSLFDEMRQFAQDALTSYQTFASNVDGCIDPDIERRAKALDLDVEARAR